MSIEIKELDDVIAQWEASILTGIAETINNVSYSEEDRAVVCGLVSVLGLSLRESVRSYAAANEASASKGVVNVIKLPFVDDLPGIKNPNLI